MRTAILGACVLAVLGLFLVLDANPLDDIANTRRISRIVIGNVEVDRPALVALMR